MAAPARSADAIEADKLFWETFHGRRYEDIQKALDVLTAAYLKAPNDAVTALSRMPSILRCFAR